MELLEGKTLADDLTRGPLPIARALTLGLQIAEALDVAHTRGVIHRDLKPGNVMITREGAKLLDFGLAKLHEIEERPGVLNSTCGIGLTEEGAVLGTYPYMSPEQLQGREADARSDVFALGVVLYEMATGRRPFEGDNRAAVIRVAVAGDVRRRIEPASARQRIAEGPPRQRHPLAVHSDCSAIRLCVLRRHRRKSAVPGGCGRWPVLLVDSGLRADRTRAR
jgi:serine/threonine protein kinase